MARKTTKKTLRTASKKTAKKSAPETTRKTAKPSAKKTAKTSAKKTAREAGRRSSGASTKRVPTAAEIGGDLIALCNIGRSDEVVTKWYHPRLVSVEGDGMTTRGLKALAGKYAWWDANNEVHSLSAIGPFVGHTGFAVRFDLAVTPKGGQRSEMSEIAVYTVRAGKIVREEFMYGG